MKLINQFLKYLFYELNYSKNTVKNYQYDLKEFYDYFKIIPEEYSSIREYLMELYKKNYQKKSIARKISSLRSFYKYLFSENKIKNNPMILISNPKLDKKLPKYLNYEELEKVLLIPDDTTLIGARDALILEMLYSTGIRVSELVNIKLSDINFEEFKIKILGKGNKERIVYYVDICFKKLKNYLKLRKSTNEYLFLNKHGNQLSDRLVRQIVDEVGKKANLKMKISPHVFRHTFATHMLNEGADLKSVQELLGHENISTTSIYTHVSNEHLRNVYLNCHPRAKK